MIKITFEFESVIEAATFLRDGSLGKKTNQKFPPSGTPGYPGGIGPQVEDQDEKIETTDVVHKRKSRVGKGASKSKSVRKKGASKKVSYSRTESLIRELAPVSDEITDADLAKAASHGAEKITPVGVTAILTQFNVAHVSELEGDTRREFLEMLDDQVNVEAEK